MSDKIQKRIPKKKANKTKECILTICAHNDDQLLGVGGTIRKMVNEGKEAYTYIFSYGETSHPHLKPEVIAKIRERESFRAAAVLGDKITYFGWKEGNFMKEADPLKIEKVIREKKPAKIFTHSPDDPHPDHKAVFKITRKILQKINYKGDLYSFNVWNLFAFGTRNYPKLFVDISDTFGTKIEAFRKHKSQTSTKISIGWSFYLKAIFAGWQNKCRYAELFYKVPVYDKENSDSN